MQSTSSKCRAVINMESKSIGACDKSISLDQVLKNAALQSLQEPCDLLMSRINEHEKQQKQEQEQVQR